MRPEPERRATTGCDLWRRDDKDFRRAASGDQAGRPGERLLAEAGHLQSLVFHRRRGAGGRLLLIAGATAYGDQKAGSISGLESTDDYTIRMTLEATDSTWLLTLGDCAGMGILPEHVLRDVAPDQLKQHPFSLNPSDSAGVFQFGKWETDQYLEIRRNDAYGGDRARLDSVFFKTLTRDVALAQLDKGEAIYQPGDSEQDACVPIIQQQLQHVGLARRGDRQQAAGAYTVVGGPR